MTVEELVARFPEVPVDLIREPELVEFANAFDSLLRVANKPSPCSKEHDVGNHYYLKLLGPLDIYRYGLFTRERVIEQIQSLLERHRVDPEGFVKSLLPVDMLTKSEEY